MSEYNLNWFGMLTTNNIDNVVELLRELLTGKRYTFVAANEYHEFRPEVRTSQVLRPSVSGDPFSVHHSDNFSLFNVCDSYGVWGCSTNLTEDRYDSNFHNPYFSFEWNKVTITHRAPAGHKLYWVIAVEKE